MCTMFIFTWNLHISQTHTVCVTTRSSIDTFSLIAHTNIKYWITFFYLVFFFLSVQTLLVLFILGLSKHTLSNLFMPDVFLSLCLALMVASLLETIFITNLLCFSASASPVPHWIKVFVLQILGRLVFLTQKTKEQRDAGTQPLGVILWLNTLYTWDQFDGIKKSV